MFLYMLRPRSQLSTNVMEALDADFDEGREWLALETMNGPTCLMHFFLEILPNVYFLVWKKERAKKKHNANTIWFGASGPYIWDSRRKWMLTKILWCEALRGAIIAIDPGALSVIRHEVKTTKSFWKRPNFSDLGRGQNLNGNLFPLKQQSVIHFATFHGFDQEQLLIKRFLLNHCKLVPCAPELEIDPILSPFICIQVTRRGKRLLMGI